MECGYRAARFVHVKSTYILRFMTVFLAIDRVHRIGQERTVFVTHFIVCTLTLSHSLHSVERAPQISNTIEGRILQIQKKKTAIIKEAFKGQSGGDSESMENLRIMFGEDE